MSSFARLIGFLLFSLLGFALIPRLPFQLLPSHNLPALQVRFEWPNAAPEVIEQQATTPLEGILATLKELKSIRSSSYPGYATIQLDFNEEVDLDLIRYEAASLIRLSMPKLPEAMSYPSILAKQAEQETDRMLLTYTLNGEQNPDQLQRYAKEVLSPELSQIRGISDIQVYGASPSIWELNYDPHQWQSLKIDQRTVSQSIQEGFFQAPLDAYTHFRSSPKSISAFPNFPLIHTQDSIFSRILHLKDIVDIQHTSAPPNAYYRINGLNSINLIIQSESDANQLQVATVVKKLIQKLEQQMPPTYALLKTYDGSIFLKEEIEKIISRSIISLTILLLFVWLISRSWRYLLIILLALAANLGIAAFCYYSLNLELHLYSLAGVTVSLGLIIDNSIVMIDHLRRQGNKRVFNALLAATLTTIGALTVIFFLEDAQQIKLLDFAWVMMVNLFVSLVVAWWLIPALLTQLGFADKEGKNAFSRRNRSRRFYRKYHAFIQTVIRFRSIAIPLAVLTFGLPFFLLPDKWEHQMDRQMSTERQIDSSSTHFQWVELYNQSLGHPEFVRTVKPWINKWLGGSLRLFIQETYPNARYVEPIRTSLYVNAQMPYGSTIEQMNETFIRIENFLAQFDEIDQFQSKINSSQEASITIFFKPVHENGSFPFFLKSRLERQATTLGGADWSIYGVGQGFNNAIGMGSKNSRITLLGYNYETLKREGEKLRMRLLQHPRIKEVHLNGRRRWDYRPHFEYVMNLDKSALARNQTHPKQILQFLQQHSQDRQSIYTTSIGNKYEQIVLKANNSMTYDLWDQFNQPIPIGSGRFVKLSDIAQLDKQTASDVIDRFEQQYQLLVEYDFIGAHQLQDRMVKQMQDETNQLLPLGYQASTYHNRGWGEQAEQQQYLLVLLVIAIIYLVCAVLLESLLQPLAVISLIPISFIGVFLTFYGFEFNFDQGGYAAFLLLSGISVNAALYLINDFNHFCKQSPNRDSLSLYLKAFRSKIIPISLTILSTMLGLIPFLMGGSDDPFWFSLAVGTMGGLVFSVIGIGMYLPIFLIKKINPVVGSYIKYSNIYVYLRTTNNLQTQTFCTLLYLLCSAA